MSLQGARRVPRLCASIHSFTFASPCLCFSVHLAAYLSYVCSVETVHAIRAHDTRLRTDELGLFVLLQKKE